ncbi:MAG: transporter substrate-binding domain-containing protein [Prochloraceae cyanobacterium]|nr:transporter substrate-binding domain-containing protein [Prochloraceae cyanobacterium]
MLILSKAKLVSGSKRVSLIVGLAITWLLTIPAPAPAQKLRVGVAGSAPFAIEDGDEFKGISLDIWKEIAREQEFEYELIKKTTVLSGLNAVANDQLDLLIGPISITPQRLETMKIEFTQPIFFVEIGLVLPSRSPSLWSRVKPFFGIAALSSVFGLCFLLFVVGNLIWLVERHQNSQQFPAKYLSGVGNGIWLALVTLTTVGYGDRAPVTKGGRLIVGIWMLISLLTVSSITAGLASAITISLSELAASEQFASPADLQGAKIAVVSGTTSVEWGKYYQAQLLKTDTLKEALDLVISGQTQGAIFDRPALKYYLNQHPKLKLRLASFSLATETYGFVVPQNSYSLERSVNLVLLEMHQQQQIRAIADKWLKDSN